MMNDCSKFKIYIIIIDAYHVKSVSMTIQSLLTFTWRNIVILRGLGRTTPEVAHEIR